MSLLYKPNASADGKSGRFEETKEPYWARAPVDIATTNLAKVCGREGQKQELIGSFAEFR